LIYRQTKNRSVATMTVEFFIHPTDKDGEPLAGSDVWVVQELDYVHCICTNPETAKVMLAGIKQAHSVKEGLRKEREKEVVYSKNNETVTTRSSLAEKVVKPWKGVVKSTTPISKPAQTPESPADAMANSTSTQSSKPTPP